jgi:hypothetical protein
MSKSRADLAAAVRPFAPDGQLQREHIPALNALADALGLAADDPAPVFVPAAAPRLTVVGLQTALGVTPDGRFGPASVAALMARFTNAAAPALTDSDYASLAARWRVPVGLIKGVRKVEAPRGAYDDQGRPSALYERHVFRRNCEPAGRFDSEAPLISGGPYGAGGYGPFSVQYQRLAMACALDPEAAFRACSWGAFQVLAENAVSIGYSSAFDMALKLVESEAAHLECFARFVEHKGLVDKFRACVPNNPVSCRPFVAGYNGEGYHQFQYDVKLAEAIA